MGELVNLLTVNYLFLLLYTFGYGAVCFGVEEGYWGTMCAHVTRLHSLALWRWRSTKVVTMARQGLLNFTNTLGITNYR